MGHCSVVRLMLLIGAMEAVSRKRSSESDRDEECHSKALAGRLDCYRKDLLVKELGCKSIGRSYDSTVKSIL